MPLFSKTKRQHKLTRINVPEAAHKAAKPKKPVEVEKHEVDEEDEDIFSIRMREDRERSVEEASTEVVGGDTASFKPLRLDVEEEDEETEEEEFADEDAESEDAENAEASEGSSPSDAPSSDSESEKPAE